MTATAPQRTSYVQGWKLYFFCALGHHVQGAVAAVAILNGSLAQLVAAVVWTGLYIAYQALTRIRKQDAAGLDVADYLAGFGAGAAGSFLYGWLI